MTIDQFIDKWCVNHADVRKEFQQDLFSAIKGKKFQNAAIEVLSAHSDSLLQLFKTEHNGVILFGNKYSDPLDRHFQVCYAPEVGVQEADWRMMLELIVSYYISSNANT